MAKYHVFQPFLRFYIEDALTSTHGGVITVFQPFLRFYMKAWKSK